MLLANGAWPWAKSAGLTNGFLGADFKVSIRLVRCKILIAPRHSRVTLEDNFSKKKEFIQDPTLKNDMPSESTKHRYANLDGPYVATELPPLPSHPIGPSIASRRNQRVHEFLLGLNNAGLIMLAVSLSGLVVGPCLILPLFGSAIMGLIGLIEGIIYLTKS